VRSPEDGHVWYSVHDDDTNTTWLFDTTFLMSNFTCIYGQGCPSIDSQPDLTETLGCCTHGAHLVDKQDRRNVSDYAALLTDEDWQFRSRAAAKGGPLKKNKKGDWVTRKVNDACIFLNRSDFEGGGGCALHRAAERLGQRPMDWKPDVCWQVPVHLDIHEDDYGHETVLVKAWQRRNWGPGGSDFHWWCIENAESYVGANPVYISLADELIEMVGQAIYDNLRTALDHRIEMLAQAGPPVVAPATPVQLSD